MAEFDALGIATRVASSPLAADEAYEVKHAWHETIHTFGGRGNDGSVELVFVETADHGEVSFIAKAIQGTMNGEVLDQETTTFDAEAAFYGKGHALTLLEAGCRVPQPLLVEQGMHGLELLICITKLEGEMLAELDMHQLERVVRWLARMHAAYWGHSRADTAVAPGGLKPHGGYWSTEQCGIEGLPTDGWEGRLRIAAKSIEDRVRAFPLTTVVHGDVKEGNIIHVWPASRPRPALPIFALQQLLSPIRTALCSWLTSPNLHLSALPRPQDEDGDTVGLIDFEYTGKACAAEDLARLLHCMGGTPEPTPELVSLVLGQYHSVRPELIPSPGSNNLASHLCLAFFTRRCGD